MKSAAVVGLGNMGLGMARNLFAAGFDVIGYDLRHLAGVGLSSAWRPFRGWLPRLGGRDEGVVWLSLLV